MSAAIKGIVFDFDGTLVLGSETCKQQAWKKLFPHHEELVVSAHAAYAGKGSRHDIIRYIFASIGMEMDDSLVQNYLGKFDTLVQEGIMNEGMSVSAKETLTKLSQKVPLFVSTATPEDAIHRTLAALGVENIFTQVFAWPSAYGMFSTKADHLKKIKELLHCVPEALVLVGDSKSDWLAAKESGSRFIGIHNGANDWIVQETEFSVIKSIGQLETHPYIAPIFD